MISRESKLIIRNSILLSLNLARNMIFFSKTKIELRRSRGKLLTYLRIKSDIDKNTILDLREEIDILKVNLQKACLHIEELIRENTLKKRMNDARLN